MPLTAVTTVTAAPQGSSAVMRFISYLESNTFYMLIASHIQQLSAEHRSPIISTLLWMFCPVASLFYYVMKWTLLIQLQMARFVYNVVCTYLFIRHGGSSSMSYINRSPRGTRATRSTRTPRGPTTTRTATATGGTSPFGASNAVIGSHNLCPSPRCPGSPRSRSLSHSHSQSYHSLTDSISSDSSVILNSVNNVENVDNVEMTRNERVDKVDKVHRRISRSVRIYNPWLQKRKRCQIATEMNQIDLVSLGCGTNGMANVLDESDQSTMGGKAFEQSNFSSGLLILKPNSSKPTEKSIVTEVFYVIACERECLLLEIGKKRLYLSSNCTFFIPPQNDYSIKNLSKNTSIELHFVLIENGYDLDD